MHMHVLCFFYNNMPVVAPSMPADGSILLAFCVQANCVAAYHRVDIKPGCKFYSSFILSMIVEASETSSNLGDVQTL